MEDYLVAMGVASLEILEPQTHLSVGRQRPELHRPDTMIGLKDWECMRAFRYTVVDGRSRQLWRTRGKSPWPSGTSA
jgi:hypothetical protein